MKARSLLSLGTILGLLGAGSIPVLAQPQPEELKTIRTRDGVTTGLAVAQSTTQQLPGTVVPSSPSTQPQASQELPVLRKGC